MLVFSTLNNSQVEKFLLSRLPKGVKFTDKDIDKCDVAFLVARSVTSSTGVKDIKPYLAEAMKLSLPTILLTRDEELLKEANGSVDHIISDLQVTGELLAEKLRDVICKNDYEIILEDGEYSIGDTFTPVQTVSLDAPYVLFLGIKGGVGVSTITALAHSVLGGIHIEIVNDRLPSAKCYHNGGYETWDISGDTPEINDSPVLLDVSSSVPLAMLDQLIEQAKCVVMVVDKSNMSFKLFGETLSSGFKPDVLVVNGVIGGVGNGAIVYSSEYEDALNGVPVLEVPGSIEEDKIINAAQKKSVAPNNAMLNEFAGEISATIRQFLGEGE